MAQKTATILVLVLLMGFGFLAGSFFGGFFGQLTVPTSHKAIIDSMEVKDVDANFKLTAKLTDSGNNEWMAGLSTLATFTAGQSYPQTIWLWQRYGDTEVVISIWGPSKDDKYLVEVASLGSGPFTVKVDGTTKVTIPKALDSGSIGHYWFDVEVT